VRTSNLNKKVYGRIEKWLDTPIEGAFAYVFLDGIWLKRCWAGEGKFLFPGSSLYLYFPFRRCGSGGMQLGQITKK
jgi:hypothetical protein